MTDDNVVPLPLTDQDERDIADMNAEPSAEPPVFHPILRIWQEILSNVSTEREKQITLAWAARITGSYQGLRYADMPDYRDKFYDMLQELLDILEAEIATDDECLKTTTPAEDLEQNSQHYKNLLTDWQKRFLAWELDWQCTDQDAEISAAAISEVHTMVFSNTGIVNHLGNIKFEFTEADQAVLAAELEAMKEAR